MKDTHHAASSQIATQEIGKRKKTAKRRPSLPTEVTKKPPTAISTCIQNSLKEIGKSLGWLAAKLEVSRTTLWRFMKIEGYVHRNIQVEALCDALCGVDKVKRRKFLKLMAAAGLTATVPVGDIVDRVASMTVLRHHQVDLDIYEDAIDGWSAALSSNHNPRDTMQRMEGIHRRLRGIELPFDDERFVRLRLRGGMLLATLQEAVLPWYDRTATAIATYDELNRDIFRHLPRGFLRDNFAEEHLRLMSHRAILHRENANFAGALTDFDSGDMTLAMVPDPCLRVAFRCQRLHTLAVMNDVTAWQRELLNVREYVEKQQVTAEQKQTITAMIDYIAGRAYKRFAWNLRGSAVRTRQRTDFAEDSIHVIDRLLQVPDGAQVVRWANLQHAGMSEEQSKLQLEVSKLEVSVWLDAQEAIAFGERLRTKAEKLYPSIINKINASIRFAGLIVHNPEASRASDHLGFVH